MEVDKQKIRKAQSAIRKILLEEWDPIGVTQFGGPSDEYDSYIGPIFTCLSKNPSSLVVAELLRKIETERMELDSPNADHLLPVAESLLKVDIDVKKSLG
jgi:hypothetical protein